MTVAQNTPDSTPRFHRSTFCGAGGCVEVAVTAGERIALRDAKDTRLGAPILEFTRVEWDAFLAGVHDGQFSFDALHDAT